MANFKKITQSRTFWLAVVQAITGIATVVFTELDMVGTVAVLKSITDIVLRLDTDTAVKL